MRVVFYSYGTRGDAQPQVALAAGLALHGIDVRVAAPENLRSFVERAGVEYAPLHGNSQEIMESESGQKWLRSGNVRAFMSEAAKLCEKIDPDVFRMGLDAARDADAIVGGTLAEDLAFTLAEHRKIPFAFGHTIPFETTGAYPNPCVTPNPLPFAALNRFTYWLFRKLATGVHAKSLATFRRDLGLPPLPTTVVSRAAELGVPALQLWSEHLVPHPADAAPGAVTTGFLRMPPSVRARLGEAAPPASLTSWIDAGPPPVYVGFGSMPLPTLSEFAADLRAIAEELGIRIALSGGWNDVAAVQHLAGDALQFIEPVDHGWLFPRCAAVVHHGGAGTTAAGLEAGVPTVICSFFADQPFWGARVEKLGVGAHLPIVKLTRPRLTDAVRRVLTDDVRGKAKALGEKLRAEDGNARAVAALVRMLGIAHPAEVAAG